MLRVLRALAAFQIFRVTADGSVAHTPRSRLLRTDTPNSMHHAARFWTGPGSWGAWGMLDVAMAGGIPHEAAWNMGRFAYLRQHQEEARVFDAMMANFPDNRHAAIASAYDFSDAGLIADIGGGNGAALRHILGRFSAPRGLVFDREDVIDAITPEERMDGRIAAQGGSFFNEVPGGADVYLLIRVLHDWSDEDCVRILRTIRAAIGAHSLLLLGEQIPGSQIRARPGDRLSDRRSDDGDVRACPRAQRNRVPQHVRLMRVRVAPGHSHGRADCHHRSLADRCPFLSSSISSICPHRLAATFAVIDPQRPLGLTTRGDLHAPGH